MLVDDGLATGATMRAAIGAVRTAAPAAVIVAVPVGAPDTCDELAALVDDLVCPLRPGWFHAVGQWYRNFDATTDADVARLLGPLTARSPADAASRAVGAARPRRRPGRARTGRWRSARPARRRGTGSMPTVRGHVRGPRWPAASAAVRRRRGAGGRAGRRRRRRRDRRRDRRRGRRRRRRRRRRRQAWSSWWSWSSCVVVVVVVGRGRRGNGALDRAPPAVSRPRRGAATRGRSTSRAVQDRTTLATTSPATGPARRTVATPSASVAAVDELPPASTRTSTPAIGPPGPRSATRMSVPSCAGETARSTSSHGPRRAAASAPSAATAASTSARRRPPSTPIVDVVAGPDGATAASLGGGVPPAQAR